jgi:hypothetical protein
MRGFYHWHRLGLGALHCQTKCERKPQKQNFGFCPALGLVSLDQAQCQSRGEPSRYQEADTARFLFEVSRRLKTKAARQQSAGPVGFRRPDGLPGFAFGLESLLSELGSQSAGAQSWCSGAQPAVDVAGLTEQVLAYQRVEQRVDAGLGIVGQGFLVAVSSRLQASQQLAL